MCMDVFPAFMSTNYMCAWYLKRPNEGIRSPETIVSHHVSVGNQMRIFWKSSQCS